MPSLFHFTPSPLKKRRALDLSKYESRRLLTQKRREQQRTVAASRSLKLEYMNDAVYDANDTVHEQHDVSNDKEDDVYNNSLNSTETGCVSLKNTVDTGTQTYLTYTDIDNIESECQHLRCESLYYKGVADANNFCERTFANDDDKVKYCTGLPTYATLMLLFNNVDSFFKETKLVSKFQQFMMTLMRLRLDVPLQLLGYIFGIHTSTVSRIFHMVIDVMNIRLVPLLVFWPERQNLRLTLPVSFRQKFSKCACIIDCFEIFIQRPSDLQARADTYSTYKSHNTVKYLIAIAPQGMITFISDGWGGRTSDSHLTENCGFLNNIQTGDVILADRGFTVSDSVAFCHAELKIPAFTKGKQQLSALDVETSRLLASVRIHIERVIGVVRQKYSMLNSTIPITFLQTDNSGHSTKLDKIVRVACALTNVSPSVVPFD